MNEAAGLRDFRSEVGKFRSQLRGQPILFSSDNGEPAKAATSGETRVCQRITSDAYANSASKRSSRNLPQSRGRS